MAKKGQCSIISGKQLQVDRSFIYCTVCIHIEVVKNCSNFQQDIITNKGTITSVAEPVSFLLDLGFCFHRLQLQLQLWIQLQLQQKVQQAFKIKKIKKYNIPPDLPYQKKIIYSILKYQFFNQPFINVETNVENSIQNVELELGSRA